MFVGLVQLFSAATGELLAIMPDGFIQQTRVAVTSALGNQGAWRARIRKFSVLSVPADRRTLIIVS